MFLLLQPSSPVKCTGTGYSEREEICPEEHRKTYLSTGTAEPPMRDAVWEMNRHRCCGRAMCHGQKKLTALGKKCSAGVFPVLMILLQDILNYLFLSYMLGCALHMFYLPLYPLPLFFLHACRGCPRCTMFTNLLSFCITLLGLPQQSPIAWVAETIKTSFLSSGSWKSGIMFVWGWFLLSPFFLWLCHMPTSSGLHTIFLLYILCTNFYF